MQGWRNLIQASKYQIYLSNSLDPFLNLSIEHFLLQKAPRHSTILFLYVNNPCVVIGRNQNPWLETNLKLLRQPPRSLVSGESCGYPDHLPIVQLVRRRSGGGTVFHDHGNVNYSVICPAANFTRDKHAEMVTKAIRESNLRARVNERHDIVLDQGALLEENDWPNPLDMHNTMFRPESRLKNPLKTSGSAYKMRRQRSLHHGTCLLSSPNLTQISRYIESAAGPFMKARGVESVRSPIGNVLASVKTSALAKINESFEWKVIKEFTELYKLDMKFASGLRDRRGQGSAFNSSDEMTVGYLDEDVRDTSEIYHGVEELKVSVPRTKKTFTKYLHYSVIQMDLWPDATIYSIQSCCRRRRQATTAFTTRLPFFCTYLKLKPIGHDAVSQ